ncbi:MAG: hypothetical protein AXA67_12370 [Methylothermaceae bacteria B42]|nr:MAG: hypothetical protein AXA67_12370 [Methylothermaceae bacteria B42]HHJ37947.1 GGDEF domain-containing protein [Methylothermaceae bacterium]
MPVQAGTLNITQPSTAPIGKSISWFQESQPLDMAAASQKYRHGVFKTSSHELLNFGIGSNPIWLAIEVKNDTEAPLLRRLSLKNSWLDKIHVYFLAHNRLIKEFQTGDMFPFHQRPIPDRYFDFDYPFPPGETLVLIRAATVEPMILPVFLTSPDQDYQRDLLEGYSYGLLYGGLSLLAAYNFLLFLSLKSARYFYYSAYLTAFLLLNITYTGHGYRWLWPNSPQWQFSSHFIFNLLFPFTGLLFALHFLDIKLAFPRLYHWVIWISTGCLSTIAGIIIVAHNYPLAISLILMFTQAYCIGMILLGVLSLRAGERAARFFLLGTVTHIVTSMFSILTVEALIPYSILGHRSAEIGLTIDALLLAFALADQFRTLNHQKMEALELAMLDPLTSMNNRRAFYWQTRPIWNNCIRKKRAMSLVMIDIDHFKRINDVFGHSYGDVVLKKVAQILMKEARTSDVAARWGGEEFVLFMGETSLPEAFSFAERIREKASNIRLTDGNKSLFFSVSIGVASVDYNVSDLDELIATADKSLYLAKKNGRNQVCTTQEATFELA